MKCTSIRELVDKTLADLNVPTHRRSVRQVPSSIEVEVVIGDGTFSRRFRTGTLQSDIERELGRLAGLLEREKERKSGAGQIDLEDAVAAAKPTS